MTEKFILSYAPERVRRLGFRKYYLRYRDLTILPSSSLSFTAYNELWYIVDDPPGLIVESDYGIYDSTGDYLSDNSHEHKGEILISNPDAENKRIKFIQVVIIN
jgi:hypothetical protein